MTVWVLLRVRIENNLDQALSPDPLDIPEGGRRSRTQSRGFQPLIDI